MELTLNPKPRPNHKLYIQILRKMTPEQRLKKVFELTDLANELCKTGIRNQFPHLSEAEQHEIYLQRLEKCYNRNY